MHKISKAIFLCLLVFIPGVSFSQQTIFGLVTDEKEKPLAGVEVYASDTTFLVTTNSMGEYKITIPDSCEKINYAYQEFTHIESINERKVINVQLAKKINKKGVNPREVFPLGLQLTLGGHSLGSATVLFFTNSRQSFEVGVCGRGIQVGARRYKTLAKQGQNHALFIGALTNFSIEDPFILYVPLGYHYMGKNGFTFGVELGGRTNWYYNEGWYSYVGFGINLGFQF